MVITEVLAGLKTNKKKREPRLQLVLSNLVRDDRLKDPLEAAGGSKSVVKQALQSIKDLEEQYIQDLVAIGEANAKTLVTIGKKTEPISYWLIWKREAPEIRKRFAAIQQVLTQARVYSSRKNYPKEEKDKEVTIVASIDEKELAREIEEFEEMFGTLDGILSMKNATTPVATA